MRYIGEYSLDELNSRALMAQHEDVVIVSETKYFVMYDAITNNWRPITLKGDQGPMGPQGLRGSDGRNGFNGRDGKDGKDGKDGAQGPKGDPGKDGKDAYFDFKIFEEYLKKDEHLDPKITVDGYDLFVNDEKVGSFPKPNKLSPQEYEALSSGITKDKVEAIDVLLKEVNKVSKGFDGVILSFKELSENLNNKLKNSNNLSKKISDIEEDIKKLKSKDETNLILKEEFTYEPNKWKGYAELNNIHIGTFSGVNCKDGISAIQSSEDLYIQPDGYNKIYIGGNLSRAGSGILMIDNKQKQAFLNIGTPSEPIWSKLLTMNDILKILELKQ